MAYLLIIIHIDIFGHAEAITGQSLRLTLEVGFLGLYNLPTNRQGMGMEGIAGEGRGEERRGWRGGEGTKGEIEWCVPQFVRSAKTISDFKCKLKGHYYELHLC